jgi:hypothetical protein
MVWVPTILTSQMQGISFLFALFSSNTSGHFAGFDLGCFFDLEPKTVAEHVKERRLASTKVK